MTVRDYVKGSALTLSDVELKKTMPELFAKPFSVRIKRAVIFGVVAALFAWCLWEFNITPLRIWDGLGKLGSVLSFMLPPYTGFDAREIAEISKGLQETLAIAVLGTILGALVALPLSFLGAKNLNRFILFRFGVRRGFDIIRAFETLILALIFIRAFGLGPLAGVLAIAVGEIGVLAKLYAEAIENISKKPVEGVVASGGSRQQAVRFGVMPQVMPVLLSITLYNFESNVRSGTILGIVGAGGIGFILSDRISAYRWDEVWSIIILIIVMVYIIDALSNFLRMRLIGAPAKS